MTLDLGSLLGILVIIFGGVGGIVGAYGFLKATYAKTQIDALRGDRDDLKERVERLEDELTITKSNGETQKKDFDTRLAAEVTKREALQDVVTGKETLAIITKLLEQLTLSNTHTGKVVDAMAKEMGVSVI